MGEIHIHLTVEEREALQRPFPPEILREIAELNRTLGPKPDAQHSSDEYDIRDWNKL